LPSFTGFFFIINNKNSINTAVATTIGYGVFSPQTEGGQMFTIFYSLVAIPIGTSCIVAIAGMAVHGFTVLYSMTLNRLDTAFDNLDIDGGGFLDHEELKHGLIALNVKIDEEEFQHVLQIIDEDGDQQIDRNEFKTAVHLLHADLSEVSARGAELKILLITLFLWLGLGTGLFMIIEKWNFVEAIYFTMVTLTTVGLGDYAPKKMGGKILLYIFTFVGIGLVATLIHVVGDMAQKAEHEAHIKMAEARAKMLHRKKKNISKKTSSSK
jgi:voltage-gated potassium channel